MNCYFQGCDNEGVTREHIPPRSFFPDGEKEQLLTVKSCQKHNNEKAKDDLYALAHICLNASPSNRAREIFTQKITPQLKYNNGALRKMLLKGAKPQANGAVAYKVDTARLDNFFTALSCGIVYKSCGSALPENYDIRHIYHNLTGNYCPEYEAAIEGMKEFYSGTPMDILNFGRPNVKNERIYTVKVFGMPEFQTSITIVHEFFGVFQVTSMLSIKIPCASSANGNV